jgi:hypothetical protein
MVVPLKATTENEAVPRIGTLVLKGGTMMIGGGPTAPQGFAI